MPKSTLFATRGLALIVGLAIAHAYLLVESSVKGDVASIVIHALAFTGLTWLGIGDLYFAKEHLHEERAKESDS